MKQPQILKLISRLGILFWFLTVIFISTTIALYVYSGTLRARCGMDAWEGALHEALAQFYGD